MAASLDYGGLSDYLNQAGGSADVAGGGLNLSSLLGQGGNLSIPGVSSIQNLFQGISNLAQGGAGNDLSGALDIASLPALAIPGIGPIIAAALPVLGNVLGPLIQGLPANAKPNMYASYLQQQGGLPSDLGSLISAAQNQAGSGSGVLSQSGANAFNPNFMATLLEALTGQNLGTVNPSTGRQTFTAPATGNVQNPVSLSFLGEQQLMQSPGMQGLSAYGYTPQQLSTPAALKAIESATSYGDVGTGQGLGTQKVAQYLPKVVQALQAAGIYPGQSTSGSTSASPTSSVGTLSDYTSQTPSQSDTSSNNNPNYLIIPLSSLGSTGTTGTTGTTGSGSNVLTLPSSALSNLLNPSSTTPSVSLNMPSIPPSVKFSQGYSGLGLAKPDQLPTITPSLNLAGVGG